MVTDPDGSICNFARDLHAWSARCLNAKFGRSEALWSSDGLSLVRLVTPDDVFEKLVYVEVNPTAAGLVARSAGAWPGLRVTPADVLEGPRVFRRPPDFFREHGPCPEDVALNVSVPPAFAHLRPAEYVERVGAAVSAREAELRQDLRRSRRSFSGVAAVQAVDREASPRTSPPRGRLRPTIACREPARRLAELAALVTFRRSYREAMARWQQGERPVVFPGGTCKMRHYPGVLLAHPPDQARAAA